MTAPTRSGLRGQAVTRLTAQVSAVGGRVYASRSLPLPGSATDAGTAALPALLVYVDQWERSARAGYGAGHAYQTQVVLSVDVAAEGATEAAVEASLDAISAAVETALLTDATLLDALEAVPQVQTVREVSAMGDRIAGRDRHGYVLRWTELVAP
jgi:hypothetical protein